MAILAYTLVETYRENACPHRTGQTCSPRANATRQRAYSGRAGRDLAMGIASYSSGREGGHNAAGDGQRHRVPLGSAIPPSSNAMYSAVSASTRCAEVYVAADCQRRPSESAAATRRPPGEASPLKKKRTWYSMSTT